MVSNYLLWYISLGSFDITKFMSWLNRYFIDSMQCSTKNYVTWKCKTVFTIFLSDICTLYFFSCFIEMAYISSKN